MLFNRKNIAPYINSGAKVLSGVLVSALLLVNISNELRGVFYAMQSLLAAQILFDGGMSLILLKRTSKVIRNHNLQPGRYSKKRVNTYLNFLKLWGYSSSLLYVAIVTPLGYLYLNSTLGSNVEIDWKLPWLLASTLSGAMFVIRSKQIFIESSLDIDFVQLSSALIVLISFGVLAAMIFMGLALYGLFAYHFSMFIFSYLFLKERYLKNSRIFYKNENPRIGLVTKFLKSQIKLFLTYSIGFFYWNSLSLIIFKFLGPDVAGKWGVVNSVLGGVNQLSNSRVIANISLHANSLSTKRDHATAHFEKMMIVSATIFCVLSILLGVVLYALVPIYFNISTRITGWVEYFLMCSVFLINMLIGNYALAGRLVKNEPYFLFSFIVNVLTPLMLLMVINFYDDLVALLFLNFIIHVAYMLWARSIHSKIFKWG